MNLEPLDLEGLENPYPEDIFPEISDDEWKKIDELLRKHLGFPLDRVSANIGRVVFENTKDEIKQRIKQACEFYLRYKDNPELLAREQEEKYKLALEKFGYKITHFHFVKIVNEYNEWLFKLAFKDVLERIKE